MAYFEQTKLTNSSGTVINPAEKQALYTNGVPDNDALPAVRTAAGSVDEQIILLRRMVKILENQQAVDPQQRQRVTVDAITGALTLATVTTVGTVSSITAGTITTVTTVGSVTNIAGLLGWNQQAFSDPARTAYNTGLRSQLVFS